MAEDRTSIAAFVAAIGATIGAAVALGWFFRKRTPASSRIMHHPVGPAPALESAAPIGAVPDSWSTHLAAEWREARASGDSHPVAARDVEAGLVEVTGDPAPSPAGDPGGDDAILSAIENAEAHPPASSAVPKIHHASSTFVPQSPGPAPADIDDPDEAARTVERAFGDEPEPLHNVGPAPAISMPLDSSRPLDDWSTNPDDNDPLTAAIERTIDEADPGDAAEEPQHTPLAERGDEEHPAAPTRPRDGWSSNADSAAADLEPRDPWTTAPDAVLEEDLEWLAENLGLTDDDSRLPERPGDAGESDEFDVARIFEAADDSPAGIARRSMEGEVADSDDDVVKSIFARDVSPHDGGAVAEPVQRYSPDGGPDAGDVELERLATMLGPRPESDPLDTAFDFIIDAVPPTDEPPGTLASIRDGAPDTGEGDDAELERAVEEILGPATQADPADPRRESTATMLVEEGNAFFNVGQYDLAIARYGEAVRLNPELAAAHYNRANAFARTGRYDAARRDYDRAITLAPGDPDALNNRGMVNLYRQEFDAALDDFEEALSISPGDTTLRINRGLTLLQLGDPERALEDFRHGIEQAPGDAAAHYGAAQASALLDRRDDALDYLDQVFRLESSYVREAAGDPMLASLDGYEPFHHLLRHHG